MDRAVTGVCVGDIENALATAFPLERAEEWDRVGLLVGDPRVSVTSVVCALDPTSAVIDEAVARGANVVVTHHPAYLKPVAPLHGGWGGGDIVYRAASQGIALINAHTNLDRDPRAQRMLPELLGLAPLCPLEIDLLRSAIVTVYVPETSADDVAAAMSSAGGGRVGDYDRCSFAGHGVGSFTPGPDTHPYAGTPGQPARADEVRLEMITPAGYAARVVAAAVSAHPYEEPLVTVAQVERPRQKAALGMVCEATVPMTLGDLATRAATEFAVIPRVWGEPTLPLGRIACATGSAGSLIGRALGSGVTAMVAGEVRYHDATEALARGLAIIEIGHDVSEWPLVELLASVVRQVPGLEPSSVFRLKASVGWWTP